MQGMLGDMSAKHLGVDLGRLGLGALLGGTSPATSAPGAGEGLHSVANVLAASGKSARRTMKKR